MLKKTITYTDFYGKERTEDLYFNISKSELAMMELTTKGGMKARIENMMEKLDGNEIMTFFTDFLGKSYGERAEDGRAFMKSPERTAWFMNSAAYDTLFMELVTKPDYAAEFVNAVLPQDI